LQKALSAGGMLLLMGFEGGRKPSFEAVGCWWTTGRRQLLRNLG
jgi:hypothetical protein